MVLFVLRRGAAVSRHPGTLLDAHWLRADYEYAASKVRQIADRHEVSARESAGREAAGDGDGLSPQSAVLSSSRAVHRFDNDLRYRDGNHPAQTQFTPNYVLDLVRADLGGSIGLDPCTTEDNPVGALRFYTVSDDGLSQPWRIGTRAWWQWPSVFVNPPYGKAREPWVNRCIECGSVGQKAILLIPAATDTRIFQKAASTATAVVFIKGRLKFGTLRPNRRQVAASHPSALIGWNTDLAACSTLGLCTARVA